MSTQLAGKVANFTAKLFVLLDLRGEKTLQTALAAAACLSQHIGWHLWNRRHLLVPAVQARCGESEEPSALEQLSEGLLAEQTQRKKSTSRCSITNSKF